MATTTLGMDGLGVHKQCVVAQVAALRIAVCLALNLQRTSARSRNSVRA
jgi:hypothetical protein